MSFRGPAMWTARMVPRLIAAMTGLWLVASSEGSGDAVSDRLRDGTLLRQLQSGVEAQRRQALEDLRHRWWHPAGRPSWPDEPMKPLVATLRGMIRDPHERLRPEAIEVLGRLALPANDGSQSRGVRDALPELSAIASDKRQDQQLRGHAIDAMTFLGPEASPPLAGLLFDEATPLQLRFLSARALAYCDRRQLERAVGTPHLHALVRQAAQEGLCEGWSFECPHTSPPGAVSPR